MDDFYSQLGVKRKTTTAYRPCCDGLVERFNRTLADMLASYLSKGRTNWDDYISYATFAYNTSVHASTGYTPHYLMFGRDAMEPGANNSCLRHCRQSSSSLKMYLDRTQYPFNLPADNTYTRHISYIKCWFALGCFHVFL